MVKKLLITGASGFLGWYLCQASRSQWQVYGTYCSHAVEIPGATLLPVNLTDRTAVQHLFQTLQPDAVIHTAALSSPNACQNNPDLSYQVNVAASCTLAEECAATEIPCVFTSSEQVFDGTQAPYRETDPVCPINRYGEHKALAEVEMRSRYPGVIICRMPLMFGAAPTADSFIQPWIRTLRAGGTIDLFTDEIRNPVSGADAAQGLLLAIAKAQGVLHLGGQQPISRYEFGLLLAEMLQISATQLKPGRQADVSMAAPRPANASLDSSLAFELGYAPLTVQAALEQLRSQL